VCQQEDLEVRHIILLIVLAVSIVTLIEHIGVAWAHYCVWADKVTYDAWLEKERLKGYEHIESKKE